MKRHILFAATAFAVFAPVGLASAQDANMQTPAAMAAMKVTDATEFMTMAAMSDMFEIESSQLALENAKSDAVKQFAQQMITDHTANTQKLMQTVEAGGGSMEAPKALDERHQAIVQQLDDAEGETFDAAYIDAQVQAHAEAVALMTGYSQNGENEALKGFAEEALPVVQMHYEMVQKMDQGSM
jgi:putative membrane protein